MERGVGLRLGSSELDPRSVHVGFVVDNVELGQVYPRTSASPAIATPLIDHTHSFFYQ